MNCPRCLLDDSIEGVDMGLYSFVKTHEGAEYAVFEQLNPQCNFCDLHDTLDAEYLADKLDGVLKRIKGSRKPYDCLIGISGGCDSSYLLHKAVVSWGLKPLVVHFDNGWNTEEAEHNMSVMVDALEVDCIRYKYDINHINRAFLMASVSDADIPNDIAMTKLKYDTAEKYGIRYILTGHDFRTEGTVPVGWTYMDGEYIRDVTARHSLEPMGTYPNLKFWEQIIYGVKGIKQERLLYYIDMPKEDKKKMLHSLYGWKDYGGHHLENVYTAFIGQYVLPKKFGIDKRRVRLSGEIRSGKITKAEALKQLEDVTELDPSLREKVRDKLGMSEVVFKVMMGKDAKTYKEFSTYRGKYRRWKWVVWVMYKVGLIPYTIYMKYTA